MQTVIHPQNDFITKILVPACATRVYTNPYILFAALPEYQQKLRPQSSDLRRPLRALEINPSVYAGSFENFSSSYRSSNYLTA